MYSHTPAFSLFSSSSSYFHQDSMNNNSSSSVLAMKETVMPTQTLPDSSVERFEGFNLSGLATSNPVCIPSIDAVNIDGWEKMNTYPLFPMNDQSSQSNHRCPSDEDDEMQRYSCFRCHLKYYMTRKRGSETFLDILQRSSNQRLQYIVCCLLRDKQGLLHVAKDRYGVDCVVNLIATIKPMPLLSSVISVLREEVYELMIDPIASAVVVCCLDELNYWDTEFIFEATEEYLVNLAKNSEAHPLLKKCIASSKFCEREAILNKIISKSLILAKHSEGHLIIQFAMDLCDDDFNFRICKKFFNHLEELALDEYGSYVLEICFEHGYLLREGERHARYQLMF